MDSWFLPPTSSSCVGEIGVSERSRESPFSYCCAFVSAHVQHEKVLELVYGSAALKLSPETFFVSTYLIGVQEAHINHMGPWGPKTTIHTPEIT